MRLEHTIDIRRPVDEVFTFIADPCNLPQWQSDVLEVHTEPTTGPGKGSRHREIRFVVGMRIEQTLEVAAFVPSERLDLKVVDGPLQLSVSHTFASIKDGTRITIVGEGDPGPLFLFAGPLVMRTMRSQSRRAFARLKVLLEADTTP